MRSRGAGEPCADLANVSTKLSVARLPYSDRFIPHFGAGTLAIRLFSPGKRASWGGTSLA